MTRIGSLFSLRSSCAALAILTGALSPGPARAQAPEPTIEEWIAKLGDPTWETREEATRELEVRGADCFVPLVQASHEASDLEVRRRARSLLETLLARPWDEARIEAALETPATLSYDDVPLVRVLQDMSEATGATVALDPELEASRDELRIRIQVRQLKYENVLNLALSVDGLRWTISCGAIVVCLGDGGATFPEEPPDPVAAAHPDSAETLSLVRLAMTRVERLRFEGTPLAEIAKSLTEATGIEFRVPPALADRRVTLMMRDLSGDQAACLVAALLRVEYVVDAGGVSFVPPD